MAVTLGTDWKKVCEVSTKVTQNITGYTRLYMKYGNRSGLNDTIYYEIRQLAYNPYGSYFAWQWGSAIAWSIKSGNTTKANGSFTQSAIYSTKTDSTANEVVRANGSYVQAHNSDGTFSDTLTFTAPIYNSSYNTTGDIVLPNIAVNPTLVINSAGVWTVNYGASINYTLGSTNGRTIKLQYSTNNSTWTDWHTKNADGTYSYALPSLLSSFPNTYTPTMYFRAITSDGNYSSGSKSKQVTIDSNIKPSISSVVINPVNTYSVLTNNNLFVKNLTKPRITTTASAYANGGATLSQYDLTALEGYNSSVSKTNVGNNYTYGTAFQKSGSYTATVKVIDTRGGNVSKTSSAITVIDYYNPSITSVSVQRCLQNGTLSDTGTYCKLSVTYKIAPITSGGTNYNTKSLKYKIGSGSWTTISISSYNTTITQVIGGSLSTNSSYQISVQLQDLTTTVTQVVTLPTSFVLVSKRAGGKGIAFGKIAESDNMAIDLDVVVNKNKSINEINVNSLLLHYNNRQPHRAYTSTGGGVGWYKILRTPSTTNYHTKGILFSISGYNSSGDNAIADFSYYNNTNIRAKILCGDINPSHLGYIQNSDGTIDIYIYLRQIYNPIIITPLALYVEGTKTTEANEWDVWNTTYPEFVSETPTLTANFINLGNGKEVWSSTASSVNAQTIQDIDTTGYNYYEVLYVGTSNANTYYSTGKIPIGNACVLNFLTFASNAWYGGYRRVNVTSNSIAIEDCTFSSLASTSTATNNSRCVPKKIRLYKN